MLLFFKNSEFPPEFILILHLKAVAPKAASCWACDVWLFRGREDPNIWGQKESQKSEGLQKFRKLS